MAARERKLSQQRSRKGQGTKARVMHQAGWLLDQPSRGTSNQALVSQCDMKTSNTHARMCMLTHTHKHAYTHTCTHMSAHTCTHTHMHARTHFFLKESLSKNQHTSWLWWCVCQHSRSQGRRTGSSRLAWATRQDCLKNKTKN